jgi:hypothetical protein
VHDISEIIAADKRFQLDWVRYCGASFERQMQRSKKSKLMHDILNSSLSSTVNRQHGSNITIKHVPYLVSNCP